MTLSYLSGEDGIGRKSKSERKAKRKERKTERKETRSTKKASIKEKKKTLKSAKGRKAKKEARKALRSERGGSIIKRVAKVQVAPARIAFLGLVEINMMQLAKKLAKAWKQNPDKVKKFWKKFGGDPNKLKNSIIRGSKVEITGQEIGNPAAVLAAATPVIIAVVKLFKDLKVKDEGGEGGSESVLEKAIETGKQFLSDNPDTEKSNVSMPEDEDVGLIKQRDEGGGGGGGGSDKPDLGNFMTLTIDNKHDLINFFKGAFVLLLAFSFSPGLTIACNIFIIAALFFALRKRVHFINIFFNLLNF